jgi:hypothetical protein
MIPRGARGRSVVRLAPIALLAFVLLALAVVLPDDRASDPSSSGSEAAWSTPIVPGEVGQAFLGGATARRPALLAEKQRHLIAGDVAGVARVNGLLAGEASMRAAMVLDRWLPRRDRATGLLPTSLDPDGQVWSYQNTASDLFPHLTIAANLLAPDRYRALLDVFGSERRRSPALPDTVALPSGELAGLPNDERIFGAAEYAKDALLPLLERLGPDPWLGRLAEIADAVLDASTTPTPHRGPIPGDSTEVNGSMLQVLTRLYWASGEPRFLAAADRIAATYLEDVMPRTTYLPPNRWDFVEHEPLDRRRFRLSDHGNEVLAGLIEWHLAETVTGQPAAAAHRQVIRRMLDRLLDKARTPDGMWLRVIEIPSGKVEQEGVTDSWGYVFQAYLAQAYVEAIAAGGEPERATRYREAALTALRALPSYRYYAWEKGSMDGYADAVEGALYLMSELEEPAAGAWVDEQIAVMYGAQQPDGRVLDGYLDGNFIRTTLLYGSWLTHGVRPQPWAPGIVLGAAADGACLVLWMSSPTDWSGRLLFDTPRHRLHGRLPADYPRLNKWPEWFAVEPDASYALSWAASAPDLESGERLASGLPVELPAGAEQTLRVCPVR